jgi:hypothetical protein
MDVNTLDRAGLNSYARASRPRLNSNKDWLLVERGLECNFEEGG